MYMWTQILEAGRATARISTSSTSPPCGLCAILRLDRHWEAESHRRLLRQRLASDAGLKDAVEANKIGQGGFRNYYSLRASISFSFGSHDEWNISHLLNERRRASMSSALEIRFRSCSTARRDTGRF